MTVADSKIDDPYQPAEEANPIRDQTASEPLGDAGVEPTDGDADATQATSAELDAEPAPKAVSEDTEPAWQQRIAELTQALDKAKDEALRAQAAAQNTKRRAEQDVEKAHKYALDKFVASLLPVVDSLEKGIDSAASTVQAAEQTENDEQACQEQAAGAGQAAIKQGMELTLKLFLDTLGKFKVQQLNPAGEPLDPHFHHAVQMVSNPDVEPNTVLDVIQKGYTLHERVVRPAMVVVAKS